MEERLVQSITLLAVAALILIGGTAAIVVGLKTIERYRREKLANSRRTIRVSPAGGKGECEHLRSKSRAQEKPDGSIVSICKKCGVPLRRKGPGDWEAIS